MPEQTKLFSRWKEFKLLMDLKDSISAMNMSRAICSTYRRLMARNPLQPIGTTDLSLAQRKYATTSADIEKKIARARPKFIWQVRSSNQNPNVRYLDPISVFPSIPPCIPHNATKTVICFKCNGIQRRVWFTFMLHSCFRTVCFHVCKQILLFGVEQFIRTPCNGGFADVWMVNDI